MRRALSQDWEKWRNLREPIINQVIVTVLLFTLLGLIVYILPGSA